MGLLDPRLLDLVRSARVRHPARGRVGVQPARERGRPWSRITSKTNQRDKTCRQAGRQAGKQESWKAGRQRSRIRAAGSSSPQTPIPEQKQYFNMNQYSTSAKDRNMHSNSSRTGEKTVQHPPALPLLPLEATKTPRTKITGLLWACTQAATAR